MIALFRTPSHSRMRLTMAAAAVSSAPPAPPPTPPPPFRRRRPHPPHNLAPAGSGDAAPPPPRLGQDLRGTADHPVPRLVPQPVVDPFQPVQVDGDKADRELAAVGEPLQFGLKKGPVVETGQRI